MTKIIGVHRLRMGTDGEGVSTLVAFYGCPLNCRYCLNPHCKDKNAKRTYIYPETLVSELMKDDIYVQMTGGGVVFGGGEPLLQSDYILEVLELLPSGWKCRIETSLHVSWEHIEKIYHKVDKWFIDIKDLNSDIYRSYTGQDNNLVLDNLDRLSQLIDREKIHIRIPHIPRFNTDADVEKSMEYFKQYGAVEEFDYVIG